MFENHCSLSFPESLFLACLSTVHPYGQPDSSLLSLKCSLPLLCFVKTGVHSPPCTWTELCPRPLPFQPQMERTFTKSNRGGWRYLDLVVPCWGGVAAPLRPSSELTVGGPVWPVRISFFCRCGRSIVCVIVPWWRKGHGEHVRNFAEHLLPGNVTPEPPNAKAEGPKGSLEGKDHAGKDQNRS